MAQRLPTVEIETENGPVLINRSDFNPDLHKLSERSKEELTAQIERAANQGQPVEPVAPPAPPAPAAQDVPPTGQTTPPAPPAPVDPVAPPATAPVDPALMVTKKGRKHFVIDQAGQPVTVEGIDPEGYATDQAAWDAILQRGK